MTTVSETAATLRLIGDELDPIEITRQLGRPPSFGHRRGDAVATPNGGTRTPTFGMWSLATDRAKPGNLNTQVTTLLEGLTADPTVWAGLATRYKVELFCGLFIEGGNQGLALSATTLRALAERSIALDLDIYARR